MRIAMLGTGNMGKALLTGLRHTYGDGIELVAYDANREALRNLDSAILVAEPLNWFSNGMVPDAVIIAVKPFDLAAAIAPIVEKSAAGLLSPLWISIAAGKSIAFLRKLLPDGSRICRVMPNTPALIGKAMSAYSLSENASADDAAIAEKIFQACGKVLALPEKFMNAVTGLSGTGPAYVFFFLESLIEAGVMAGLPQKVSRECALQTVIGAAEMAEAFPESLADLKMKVMTPAGTTASALMVLEHHSFKDAIIKAVVAATKRSEQLEK